MHITNYKAKLRKRILPIVIMLLGLLLDQISKWFILQQTGTIYNQQLLYEVTSFFNIVLVWNRGVSFGIFANHPEYMPYLLIASTIFITVILLIWFWKNSSIIGLYGLALVIGGAVGNIIDRVKFGAVIDFLDFHIAGYHWPAFNIADTIIFIGVALLVIDSILEARIGVADG